MLTFVLSSVVMPLFSLEAPLQEPEVKSSPSYSVEKLLDSSGYLYSNAKGSVLVVEKGTGITTYDLLGRLISVQDPPTGAARILVNEDGRVRFQSTESDAWIRDVTTFGSLNWARVDEDSYVVQMLGERPFLLSTQAEVVPDPWREGFYTLTHPDLSVSYFSARSGRRIRLITPRWHGKIAHLMYWSPQGAVLRSGELFFFASNMDDALTEPSVIQFGARAVPLNKDQYKYKTTYTLMGLNTKTWAMAPVATVEEWIRLSGDRGQGPQIVALRNGTELAIAAETGVYILHPNVSNGNVKEE